MTIPFPKEHGAYGQIAFPLIAAFAVAGMSTAGALFAAAVVAVFLAHEPALIVLGQRGPRAKREQWRSAVTWLACLLLLAGAAVVGTILTVAPAAGWALLVPLLPAMALAGATLRGAEKSLMGETATSLAASGAAVPIVLAGGAPPVTAAAVAIPFALLFVSSTLAVRAGILSVRGGGNPRAASTTRLLALCVVCGAGSGLAFAAMAGYLPWRIFAATAPGLVTATVIAVWRPSPARLRALGWTLVAVSTLTAFIVVATNRSWPRLMQTLLQ